MHPALPSVSAAIELFNGAMLCRIFIVSRLTRWECNNFGCALQALWDEIKILRAAEKRSPLVVLQ